MGDRVRRNEELEAVEVLEQVLVDHRLRLAAGCAANLGENLLHDLDEEGASAAGEVEDRDALAVGEPGRNGEGVLQDVVDGADDEADHWWRGVIDAAALARAGVVGLQEILVEIDEGVL